MNEAIVSIIREFTLDIYRPIVPRRLDLGDVLVPRAGNLVKIISGMRRSGKSYRLFQEMDRLIEAGVPQSKIWYFNFEDNRIAPVTPHTGDEVLEAFRYLSPSGDDEGLYLFFDELQEMDGWGTWLRRVVDTTKATIYVTGSSSKMLSREISSEFRGRALEFELLPFSFAEFCLREGEVLDESGLIGAPAAVRTRMERHLDSYLEQGGFPAAYGLPRQQAVLLLQSYVQRVVARDVVERHDLSRPRVASALAQRLMELNARQLSIRKIENDFRSSGLVTGRAYLADLVGYFEDAYLVFQVKEHSRSLAETTTAQPKVYAVDPGLALANSKANACERGQRLEDAVYLELRRRHPEMREGGISSYRTKGHGYEVDFIVGDILDEDPYALVQVTDAMDDEKTAARELRALWEALEESGLEEATLIVGSGDSTEYPREGRRIVQVPAWRWLLSE